MRVIHPIMRAQSIVRAVYWRVDNIGPSHFQELVRANSTLPKLSIPDSLEDIDDEFMREVVQRGGSEQVASGGVAMEFIMELVVGALMTVRSKNKESEPAFKAVCELAAQIGGWRSIGRAVDEL